MVLVALNSLSSRKSSVRLSGTPSELIPSRLNCILCSSAGAKPGVRSSAWTAPEVPAVARRKAPTQDSRPDFAGLAAARGDLAGGPLGPGREIDTCGLLLSNIAKPPESPASNRKAVIVAEKPAYPTRTKPRKDSPQFSPGRSIHHEKQFVSGSLLGACAR